MFNKFLKNFKYTWNHKKAFLKKEKELLGKNTLRGYLHDIDKLFLYLFFSQKTTHQIHKMYARHHSKTAKTTNDYIEMVIDWECARDTKPKMQLNAAEVLKNIHPELKEEVLPILHQLNL